MVFTRLIEFANKKGWTIERNSVHGEENGYLFTLYDGNGFKVILTPLPYINDQKKVTIIAFLDQNKKRLSLWKYQFQNHVLEMKIREVFRNTKIETIETLIHEVIKFFDTQDIPGKNYCVICGQDDAKQIISLNEIVFHIHESCFTKTEIEIETAKQQIESENKNYLIGFLGAMLGGIVSSIPWIILQIVFSKIAAVLAYLIGIGAYKAYILFDGRLGKATKWIISIVILLCVILAQTFIIYFEFMKKGINYSYLFQFILKNPQVLKMVVTNIRISLVIALFAIITIMFQLNQALKDSIPIIKREE